MICGTLNIAPAILSRARCFKFPSLSSSCLSAFVVFLGVPLLGCSVVRLWRIIGGKMCDQFGSLLVADIGGYSIKYGFVQEETARIMPNAVFKVKSERRRLFIGDQIEESKDYSGLFYLLPFNKGYLINWDTTKQIFDYLFRTKLGLAFDEQALLYTEPYFNFRPIQEATLEILFEEYGFKSLIKATPAQLSMFKYNEKSGPNNCGDCLVVDSGYSFTHIVPFIKGKMVKSGIRRIDVGGKILTNYLKDVISYRQLHVLDETHVINQCKEDCCFVSDDFMATLKLCKERGNPIARDYVLPDFTTIKRGYVRDPSSEKCADFQSIRMNNERIQIPEILFYPSDIGINQVGIAHSINHSIESCPEEYRSILYENIILIGGNTCFEGFKKRVETEVRCLADYLYTINVYQTEDPIKDPWLGGKYLATNMPEILEKICIHKREFEEHGVSHCLGKSEL